MSVNTDGAMISRTVRLVQRGFISPEKAMSTFRFSDLDSALRDTSAYGGYDHSYTPIGLRLIRSDDCAKNEPHRRQSPCPFCGSRNLDHRNRCVNCGADEDETP
jgi:hypothetical protein